MKPLQWFLNRIGKRIYRTSNGCSCGVCEKIMEHGLVLSDEEHAEWVYDWYAMSKAEGVNLEYADTKEELE